jgi:hypothetical protein
MDEDDIEDVPAEEEFGCCRVEIKRVDPGVAAESCHDHGHGKAKDDPGKELQVGKLGPTMICV